MATESSGTAAMPDLELMADEGYLKLWSRDGLRGLMDHQKERLAIMTAWRRAPQKHVAERSVIATVAD